MNPKGFLIFDIDGVIRDVSKSYRRALQETVNYFSGWTPGINTIDSLKSEGIWNNDWDASLELLRRYNSTTKNKISLPIRKDLIKKFSNYYFGGDINGSPKKWHGFIKDEELLVQRDFFSELSKQNFKWGFFSGAEVPSAKFVLEHRLGLDSPPLLAMGDAPEKPNPFGLFKLISQISGHDLSSKLAPVSYLGDTVADILTVKNARRKYPNQKFISLGVAPPHLHCQNQAKERLKYEEKLKDSGADIILKSTNDLLDFAINNLIA